MFCFHLLHAHYCASPVFAQQELTDPTLKKYKESKAKPLWVKIYCDAWKRQQDA